MELYSTNDQHKYLANMNDKEIINYLKIHLLDLSHLNSPIYNLARYGKYNVLSYLAIPYSIYTEKVLENCIKFGYLNIFKKITKYILSSGIKYNSMHYFFAFYDALNYSTEEITKKQKYIIRKNKSAMLYNILKFSYEMEPRHINYLLKINYKYLWSNILRIPHTKKSAIYILRIIKKEIVNYKKSIRKVIGYIDIRNEEILYKYNSLSMLKYFHTINKIYTIYHLFWIFRNPFMNSFKFTSKKLQHLLNILYQECTIYDIKDNIFSSHIPNKYICKKLLYWNSLKEFPKIFLVSLYRSANSNKMIDWLIKYFPIDKYTCEIVDNFLNCKYVNIPHNDWIKLIIKYINQNSCSNELIWIIVFHLLQKGNKWKSSIIHNLFHMIKDFPIKNRFIRNLHFNYLRYYQNISIPLTIQRYNYIDFYIDCKYLIDIKYWDITKNIINFNYNFYPDIKNNVYLDAMYSIKEHVIMTKIIMSRNELIHIKYKKRWNKVHRLLSNYIQKKYYIHLYKHKLKYHVVMNELSLIPSKVYKSIPKGGEKYFNLFKKYNT